MRHQGTEISSSAKSDNRGGIPVTRLAASLSAYLANLLKLNHDSTRSVARRYGFAIMSVLAALCLTLILKEIELGRPTFLLIFVAIVASAWLGGTGPATLAIFLSLPAGLYFYSVSLDALAYRTDYVTALLVLLYAFCAVFGIAMGTWSRRTDIALALKARQLQQANDALRGEIEERRRAELALQDARGELASVSRLTSMGELAATIAHEVNQPLAAISNSAGACIRWLDSQPPNLQEARLLASWIVRDSARAAGVVSRVRAMLNNTPPEKSRLSANRLIKEMIGSLAHDLRKYRVSVDLSLDPNEPYLLGDRVQLQQVLLNLLMNAMEAMAQAKGRRLMVRTSGRQQDVEIEVEDSGGGFRAESETLFQPFYTTKPSGMGLGLAICRSIVGAHGGTMTALNGSHGARMCLVMPRER